MSYTPEKIRRLTLAWLAAAVRAGENPLTMARSVYRQHKPGGGHGLHILEGHGGGLTKFLQHLRLCMGDQWSDLQADVDCVAVADAMAAAYGQPSAAPAAPDPVKAYRQQEHERRERREQRDILKRLAEAEERLQQYERFRLVPGAPPFDLPVHEGMRDGTVLILLADWHPGERVESEAVNGLNEYSPEIAVQRARNCVEGMLWTMEMWRHRYVIRDVVVAILGDMITNWLHEEQLPQNTMTPPEEVVFGTNLLESSLKSLELDDYNSVRVVCVPGNHGRFTRRVHLSNRGKTSWEWVMYHDLARRFPDFQWHIPNAEFAYLDVGGLHTRFAHGDFFKYRRGVGGILSPGRRAIKGLDEGIKADLTCFGHWHQYIAMPRLLSCGSMMGYSAFAQHHHFAPEPPSQTIALVDHRQPVPWTKQVWV